MGSLRRWSTSSRACATERNRLRVATMAAPLSRRSTPCTRRRGVVSASTYRLLARRFDRSIIGDRWNPAGRGWRDEERRAL